MRPKTILTIVMSLVCLSAMAQSEKTPAPEKKWRWKFYPVTQVTPKDNKQVVRVELENVPEYRFDDMLISKYGYKKPNTGEISKVSVPTGKTDSLEILRPYKSGEKEFVDMLIPVLGQTFYDDNKTYKEYVEFELAAGKHPVLKGDMIAFEIERGFYNDSLLFYQLEDMSIELLTVESKPLFGGSLLTPSAAGEMAAAKILADELNMAGEMFKDRMKEVYVQTGPYAGKTAPQILMAATEKDAIHFMNYLLSYPREFIGVGFKVAEVYGSWIKNGQPKGRFGPLRVELEYNKWVKMVPLEIDLDKGTINKVPIAQALKTFTTLFPWYDDQDALSEENPNGPTYDYNLLGNGLTYFAKQKVLKIMTSGHEYLRYSKLKDLTLDEIKKKLGKPAKVIDEQRYFFTSPFGTIEFYIDGFYAAATLIYLHPVKPTAVVQVEETDD